MPLLLWALCRGQKNSENGAPGAIFVSILRPYLFADHQRLGAGRVPCFKKPAITPDVCRLSAWASAVIPYDRATVGASRNIHCAQAANFKRCKSLKRLAPQVGLEPTTLRLTARNVLCSAWLRIALCCSVSAACREFAFGRNCRDYPQLPALFKQYPYKSPYSVLPRFSADSGARFRARQKYRITGTPYCASNGQTAQLAS
jgi:hypothetical protein